MNGRVLRTLYDIHVGYIMPRLFQLILRHKVQSNSSVTPLASTIWVNQPERLFWLDQSPTREFRILPTKVIGRDQKWPASHSLGHWSTAFDYVLIRTRATNSPQALGSVATSTQLCFDCYWSAGLGDFLSGIVESVVKVFQVQTAHFQSLRALGLVIVGFFLKLI